MIISQAAKTCDGGKYTKDSSVTHSHLSHQDQRLKGYILQILKRQKRAEILPIEAAALLLQLRGSPSWLQQQEMEYDRSLCEESACGLAHSSVMHLILLKQ